MQLRRYVTRRLLQFFPLLLVIVVLNFVLMHAAPGDVASIMAGETQDPAFIAHIRQRFGFDRPFHEQLFIYIGRVARGDLGDSYLSRRPVLTIIGERIGPTLLLVGTSLVLAALMGTVIGTLVSRRAGSPSDIAVSVVAVGSYSIPVFWLGLMLILMFAIHLRWFPTSGMISFLGTEPGWDTIRDRLLHLVLPSSTLLLAGFGQYVRVARTSVLQVLDEDFITTVRAIGFHPNTILIRHALRNASLPIVSMLGLQLGLALTGAVLTETVFAWPGLGRLVYESILARDRPVIMGAYVVMAICVVVASLVTDLVYAVLDPRVVYR